MWDFEKCRLLISARSPFARRVRLAFRENGLEYEEKMLDVLKPVPELWKLNPLGRVPTAVLRDGEVILDSNLILQLFYEGRQSPLMPREPKARLECLRASVLAVGLCEKIVEYFFETLRTESHRDAEVLNELRAVLERVLTQAEEKLETGPWLVGPGITQADLDLGTALAYVTLRYNAEWQSAYPRCAELLARLDERPSFRATVPPPPAS